MATCSDRTLVARFSIPPALVICLKMTQFVSVRRRCTYFNELNGSWCQNFTPLTSNKEIFCWRLLRQVSFQLIFLTSPIRFWRITSSPGALQRQSTTELVGTKMSYKLSFSFHSKENGATFFASSLIWSQSHRSAIWSAICSAWAPVIDRR